MPGIDHATMEDATRLLMHATKHPVPNEALKAAEMLLKLHGMGGYGKQVLEIQRNPLEDLMDEIAAGIPDGGLSDMVPH